MQQPKCTLHCTKGFIFPDTVEIYGVSVHVLELDCVLIDAYSCLQACIGSKSCSVQVSIKAFGDPCRGKTKSLAVEASCE